jgi:hypothetical protein
MANNVDIQTPDEILRKGLLLQKFTLSRLNKNKEKTQLGWFQSHYGCRPVVVARIWEDLQTTEIDDARIGDKGDMKPDIQELLHAINWLKEYRTEKQREGSADLSAKTLRKKCWYYARKIQALKGQKIVFPVAYPDDTVWIMTVDGTHFAINEPRHPELSQDKDYYSHKKNRAGYCYELGMSLTESKLIWMNGPFKAGQNDKTILVAHGLKQFLSARGLKAIGDKFYNGHPKEISIFNAMDSTEVKKFKSRALLRQEAFNGMLKHFKILDGRFRHGDEEKFKTSFEAVAVINQYRIELECPLFDI